ncbi:MAG: hypothetical protein GXX83_11380 [Gaiellales bacterium]|nr:hypothetical protein [Gaiellales bacterium]
MTSLGRRVASVLAVVVATALIIYAGVHFLAVNDQVTAAASSETATVTVAVPAFTTETTAPRTTVPESDTPVTSAAVSQDVAWGSCRKGLVNDPYPGRCHDYSDTNGDDICDLSQPDPAASGAASTLAAIPSTGVTDAGTAGGLLTGGCPFGPCVACGACFS